MLIESWEWLLAIVAALIVGISKSGISGLGVLAVVLFAQIMPAKQATGVVLPLLCIGDIVAAATYRKHAKWHHIWRLFPWAAGGVIIGYLTFDRVDERQARTLIAAIVLTLVALHLLRRHMAGNEAEHGTWFAPTIGVMAGFVTLVANAAGPLMTIYMLARRLPKMDFVGTGAMYFLLMNFFKVPFMVDLGLINRSSFSFNLLLAPVVVAGAFLGQKLVANINQRAFENLALALSTIAGLKLLL